MRFIHHRDLASQIRGFQLFTDLLNDVERTLTWLAQIQTLIYFLVPTTQAGERPTGIMPSIARCVGANAQAYSRSMDDFSDSAI